MSYGKYRSTADRKQLMDKVYGAVVETKTCKTEVDYRRALVEVRKLALRDKCGSARLEVIAADFKKIRLICDTHLGLASKF